MILGFIHDHILIKKGNSYYSTGGLPNDVWKRYLKEFDKILVMTRFKEADDQTNVEKMTLSNCDGVEFIPSKYYLKMQNILTHGSSIDLEIANFLKKCDVVILRIPSVLSFRAFKLAKKMNKPVGVEIVSSTFDVYWNYDFRGKLLAPFMESVAKKIAKKADAVAYITDKYLQKQYPTKTKTFGNVANVSLDLDFFNYSKREEKKDQTTIGLLGPYKTKYKGQKMAIKAMKYLNNGRRNHAYFLELVGSGDPYDLRKYARAIGVQDYVRFLGPIKHSKIGEWFDDIDIYIQPSKAEGHGRTVIEAMGRGCPVVSTNVGGLVESVQPELQVRYNDSFSLANKIELLANDSAYMRRVSEENLKHAEIFAKFKVEERRENFLKYLKTCIKYD